MGFSKSCVGRNDGFNFVRQPFFINPACIQAGRERSWVPLPYRGMPRIYHKLAVSV